MNPLTYGLAAFRHVLYWNDPEAIQDLALPDFGLCLGVTVVSVLLVTAVSVAVVRRRD